MGFHSVKKSLTLEPYAVRLVRAAMIDRGSNSFSGTVSDIIKEWSVFNKSSEVIEALIVRRLTRRTAVVTSAPPATSGADYVERKS